MSVLKALGILKKVGTMKAYDNESEIKFEYSNATFHTAQLFVSDFDIQENSLVIKLAVYKTDCKAKETCGVPEAVSETAEVCCDTTSGCC